MANLQLALVNQVSKVPHRNVDVNVPQAMNVLRIRLASTSNAKTLAQDLVEATHNVPYDYIVQCVHALMAIQEIHLRLVIQRLNM